MTVIGVGRGITTLRAVVTTLRVADDFPRPVVAADASSLAEAEWGNLGVEPEGGRSRRPREGGSVSHSMQVVAA